MSRKIICLPIVDLPVELYQSARVAYALGLDALVIDPSQEDSAADGTEHPGVQQQAERAQE